MAPLAPAYSPRQRGRRDPLYDINPLTGATIEVFYADRALETFGSMVEVGFGGFVGVAARRRGRRLVRLQRATQRIATL
jgi:hypothetical protein